MKPHFKSLIAGATAGALLVLSGAAFAAGGTSIQATLNTMKLMLDGKSQNQTAAIVHKGTTYVPLQTVSKLTGKPAVYDSKSNTIYVGSKPSAASKPVALTDASLNGMIAKASAIKSYETTNTGTIGIEVAGMKMNGKLSVVSNVITNPELAMYEKATVEILGQKTVTETYIADGAAYENDNGEWYDSDVSVNPADYSLATSFQSLKPVIKSVKMTDTASHKVLELSTTDAKVAMDLLASIGADQITGGEEDFTVQKFSWKLYVNKATLLPEKTEAVFSFKTDMEGESATMNISVTTKFAKFNKVASIPTPAGLQ